MMWAPCHTRLRLEAAHQQTTRRLGRSRKDSGQPSGYPWYLLCSFLDGPFQDIHVFVHQGQSLAGGHGLVGGVRQGDGVLVDGCDEGVGGQGLKGCQCKHHSGQESLGREHGCSLPAPRVLWTNSAKGICTEKRTGTKFILKEGGMNCRSIKAIPWNQV